MKRIITYISILGVALAVAVSCTREDSIEWNQDSDSSITIRLQTAEMGTRVTVKDGQEVDGDEIENKLEHADFFFFKDEAGETLLYKERLEVKEGELVSVGTNLYEYTFDATVHSELKGPSYVYVIANYPDEITETTLAGILALDIKTDLSGEFDSFVMDSYDSANAERMTYLAPSKGHDNSLDKDGKVKYTIGLTRAAAKLMLSFKVAKSYTDASKNYWTPVTDQMWWNFLYVLKKTNVEAEPVAYNVENKANYFNTDQFVPVKDLTKGDTSEESEEEHTGEDDDFTYWTTSAVYTYPQSYGTSDVTAPYFKIFCPWTCEKKGKNNFYYKIILPKLDSFQRNKVYRLMVDVSVIGGTEEDWALLTDHIYVADWWAPEKIEASFEGAMYLDVPVKEFTIYGDDFIDIPVVSSNLITVTGVSGTKTNLYSGNSESVTPTISNITKEGFRLTHVLNTDMTSDGFDCTPITYTMTVNHASGGLNKPITVKVTQYPSIWVKADESNGYAYVNSYTYSKTTGSWWDQQTDNRGGRNNYTTFYSGNSQFAAWNNNGWQDANLLGTINDGTNSASSNHNQYVVTVSVLPSGYKVKGMTEDVVIGDPRGGKLAANNLGYSAGTNGNRDNGVFNSYNAVSASTQNVIAPVIRIASSWGTTAPILNYNRAEERCASYQENGYPAGRWRVPTIAEIDFLIRLSDYNHIPELFSPEYHEETYQSYAYYDLYWAGGNYGYGGKPYVEEGGGHTNAFVNLAGATISNQNNYGNYQRLVKNNERYRMYMRCVYDEWYWGSEKYNNQGSKITGTGTAATQWIGYIF